MRESFYRLSLELFLAPLELYKCRYLLVCVIMHFFSIREGHGSIREAHKVMKASGKYIFTKNRFRTDLNLKKINLKRYFFQYFSSRLTQSVPCRKAIQMYLDPDNPMSNFEMMICIYIYPSPLYQPLPKGVQDHCTGAQTMHGTSDQTILTHKIIISSSSPIFRNILKKILNLSRGDKYKQLQNLIKGMVRLLKKISTLEVYLFNFFQLDQPIRSIYQ